MALKVPKAQYAEDEQFVKRFEREAKSAAKLSPNIVAVHDAGEGLFEGRKTPYIVMEHVPGGTLRSLFRERNDPLPPSMAVELAAQVAEALGKAHRRGIVHRDIKPENILLTERGYAKVADFGIARAVSAATVAVSSALIGTPHYISPEQAEGEPASFKSDLYSLGVVLYEMLTAEVPYDAETPWGILSKHVRGRLRSPKEVNPDVPEQINAITACLLARDPEERYPDADTLLDDLKRALRSPEEPSTVEIPNLAGMNRSEANSTLATAGLKLGGQNEAPSDTVSEGEIIEQEPVAGTRAKRGSSVSITVSSGPEEATVSEPLGQSTTEPVQAEPPPSGSQVQDDTLPSQPEAGQTGERDRFEEREIDSQETDRRYAEPSRQHDAGAIGDEEFDAQREQPMVRDEEDDSEGSSAGSSRQTAQAATVRSGKRARLWIGVGLLCTVIVVGLIAVLAYSLSGEDTTEETKPETVDFTLANTLSGDFKVISVAFSPDGKLLASGSDDHTIKIWER